MCVHVHVNSLIDLTPTPPPGRDNRTHLYPTYPTHVGPGNVAVSLCVNFVCMFNLCLCFSESS